MSTYLVQLIVGDYEVIDGGTVPSGRNLPLPLMHVVPAGEQATFDAAIGGIADQIAFFEARFGPYPLDRYGLLDVCGPPGPVTDDSSPPGPVNQYPGRGQLHLWRPAQQYFC